MHSAFQDPILCTQVDRSKIPRTEDFTQSMRFFGVTHLFETIHGVPVLPELRPTASFKQRVRLATLRRHGPDGVLLARAAALERRFRDEKGAFRNMFSRPIVKTR